MTFLYVPRIKSQSALLSDWLKEVPFQAFVSVRPVHATAMDTLKTMINDFQRGAGKRFHSPLSCVISYERTPCLNCHLLIACSRTLDLDWMREYLKANARTMDCQVQAYESWKDGISYVLKCADRDDGSTWELSEFMFLYLPRQPNENRRHRIARRQHEQRLLLP